MSLQLLIVEDVVEIAELIADYATAAGYNPRIIANGQHALDFVKATPPDFIVLDIMLPGLDGLSFCKAVRAFSKVPIIMVTARVEEIDRLIGLDSGADDYLCKPFSYSELMARVRTILRRVQLVENHNNNMPITIDLVTQTICVLGQPLMLTRSEYLIFAHLLQHPGQVFSRAQLLDVASQDNLEATDRAVDSHIKNLRRKLALLLPDASPIHSIYGLGYRLDL